MQALVLLFFVISLIALIYGFIWLIIQLSKDKISRIPALIIVVAMGLYVVTSISLVVFAVSSSDISTTNNATEYKKTDSSPKTFGLNKEAFYSYDDKTQYSVELLSANQDWDEFMSGQLSYNDPFNGKKDQSIQITYKYKNYNLKDDFMASSSDFKVYNTDGSLAKDAGYQNGQTSVSKGHSATSSIYYTFNKPIKNGQKITIEYNGDGSSDSRMTFKVPVTIAE